jgi:tetratricopeptide (TPR) repeat protein
VPNTAWVRVVPRIVSLQITSWLLLLAAGCASTPEGASETPTTPAPARAAAPADAAELRLDEEAPPDLARAQQLVLEARAMRDAGDHAGAVAKLEAAVEAEPGYGLAHLEHALAGQYLGEAAEDIRPRFARALALLRENPRAFYEYAAFEEAQGDRLKAIGNYRHALSLRPEHRDARVGLARCLLAEGDAAGALLEYRRITKAEPRDVAAWIGLATTAEEARELDEAEKALRAVVKLAPDVVPHRRRLIAFYERTDQPKKAKREAKKLARVDPQKKRRLRTLKPSRRR